MGTKEASTADKRQDFDAPGHEISRPSPWGRRGIGKNHLVQAIGHELIKAGKIVLYRSIFDILADLREDGLEQKHERTMKRYLKCDLLIIDDMVIKQLPPKSGEHLFEIIMRRYELRSTLMTSNRPLVEWGKLIGDVPAATAILDRFLHHCHPHQNQREKLPNERSQCHAINRSHGGSLPPP